jgi:hypothetical protein
MWAIRESLTTTTHKGISDGCYANVSPVCVCGSFLFLDRRVSNFFSSPLGLLLLCYTTPREYNISLRMMIGAQGNPPKKKKKKDETCANIL